jgi:transposase InsO family protein
LLGSSASRRRDGHTRLRWQAEHAGALWHGDVCHGPALRIGKTTKPLRIHALLDDASRYVVALEARHTEREDDLLDLMLAALRRHGAPAAFYFVAVVPAWRDASRHDRHGRPAHHARVSPARDDDPPRHAVGIDRTTDLTIAEPVTVEYEVATGGTARRAARHAGSRPRVLHRRR